MKIEDFTKEDIPELIINQLKLDDYDTDRITHSILYGWSKKDAKERGSNQPYSVSFKVVEGETELDAAKMYDEFNDEGIGQLLDELKSAEPLIEGHVKWDGCSNMWFGDEDTYVHTCDKYQMTAIGVILGQVYDFADKVMGID